MTNKKSLPIKGIGLTLLFILGIVLLGLYFYKWHQVREDEKYLQSYLISTNTINLETNDIKEIKTVLSESPTNYYIYIGYKKATERLERTRSSKKLMPLNLIIDI